MRRASGRGATVVLVANDGDEETARQADAVLWVPETEYLFAPIVDVVPLQMFAPPLLTSATNASHGNEPVGAGEPPTIDGRTGIDAAPAGGVNASNAGTAHSAKLSVAAIAVRRP